MSGQNTSGDTQNRVTRSQPPRMEQAETSESPAINRRTRDQPSSNNLLSEMLRELKSLNTKFDELREFVEANLPNTVQVSLPQTTQCKIEVDRIISIHSKIWNDTLSKRKRDFFNHLKNSEKAKIYEQYLNNEPTFIPKCCKETKIKGQTSDEWIRLNNEREISNVNHEIQIMKTFALQHKESFEECDASIMEVFTHFPQEKVNQIREVWMTEVKTEEQVSKSIWKKKAEFLTSLPERPQEERADGINAQEQPISSKPSRNNPNHRNNRTQQASNKRRQSPRDRKPRKSPDQMQFGLDQNKNSDTNRLKNRPISAYFLGQRRERKYTAYSA